MGISIMCGKKSFSCGYGNWNKFRIDVIYATIEYLQSILSPLSTTELISYTRKLNTPLLKEFLKEDNNEEIEISYNEIIIDFIHQFVDEVESQTEPRRETLESKTKEFKEKILLNEDCRRGGVEEGDARVSVLDIFNNIYTESWNFNDAFIHFDLGGLYSLCNKNDYEGYYSIGNSYDICELFLKIKPFININGNEKDDIEEDDEYSDEKIFCRRSFVKDKVITDATEKRNTGDDKGIERVCRRGGVADVSDTLNSGVKDARVYHYHPIIEIENLFKESVKTKKKVIIY